MSVMSCRMYTLGTVHGLVAVCDDGQCLCIRRFLDHKYALFFIMYTHGDTQFRFMMDESLSKSWKLQQLFAIT